MRERFLKTWLELAARNRRVLVVDLVLLGFAVYIAFALRLTLLVTPTFRPDLIQAAVLYPLCITLMLWRGGTYRVHWPQASVEEYVKLTRSYVFGSTLFLCANFFLKTLTVPRTSLAIMLFAGIVFIGAARASWRLLEFSLSSRSTQPRAKKRTIIIGAGEAGAFVARDLQRHPSDLLPLGFVDDDPQKRGKIIAGLPVLGSDEELDGIVRSGNVQVALIAIPSASGAKVRKYLDALSRFGVEVRVLPSMRELAGGKIEVGSLRSVQLQDLLRREPIVLDEARIETIIAGKRVLVTGAGGSIGSEICAQLAKHAPAELLVLGHGEQSIYNLLQKMAETHATVPCRPIIADISDEIGMSRVWETYRPEIVFHAAAHKHVPLMEENPREALRVNALGTWTIANLAGRHRAERFVMISTDKAVHPSSVMGATKRLAERLLCSAQDLHQNTAYMTVRFGNVLGSRGSVVPLFERQIAQGGPVTVTHREMTRYFMLIPEAVSLVLEAASMGGGGELYVLDMGEPVNITEMAETLIRLHGREPYTDIPIVFTGTRRGEKLYEELFYDPNNVDKTSHDKIFLSALNDGAAFSIEEVCRILALPADDEQVRQAIFSLCTA